MGIVWISRVISSSSFTFGGTVGGYVAERLIQFVYQTLTLRRDWRSFGCRRCSDQVGGIRVLKWASLKSEMASYNHIVLSLAKYTIISNRAKNDTKFTKKLEQEWPAAPSLLLVNTTFAIHSSEIKKCLLVKIIKEIIASRGEIAACALT